MDSPVPRMILSGIGRGVGKSLIGIGLAVALRKRKLSLSTCVVGPYLPQSVIYKRLTGRSCTCLDEKLLTPEQIAWSVQAACVGADLLLIEGHAGLFDSFTSDSLRGSDAAIAIVSQSPVTLIVDGRSLNHEIYEVVNAYSSSANGFPVAGVIVNNAAIDPAGEVERQKYEDACRQAAHSPIFLGAIPPLNLSDQLVSGVIQAGTQRTSLSRNFFVEIGQAVEKYVDLDRFISLTREATGPGSAFSNNPMQRRTRIAVADDGCFNICFQDNLDLLRYFGAEIVPFSPLAESDLPKKIGGLYIPGGFIHAYGRDLTENRAIRASIFEFAKKGGVLYSEGDGTAFLCRDYCYGTEEVAHGGVGILPASANTARKTSMTYNDVVVAEDSILGSAGITLRAVFTNEWKLMSELRIVKALRVNAVARQPYAEGYSPGPQIVSTFGYIHFGSNPVVAKNLVDAAEVVQRI